MQIQGTVIATETQTQPPKELVKIESETDTFWVECRKQLVHSARLLKPNDKVKITACANARESKNSIYNNIVAKTIERL